MPATWNNGWNSRRRRKSGSRNGSINRLPASVRSTGAGPNGPEIATPALSPKLFDPAVEEHAKEFERWLGEPPARPFIAAADSRDEALAFVCRLVRKAKSETDEPDAGAVVFDAPEAMQQFRAADVAPRLAIVHNDQVEKEIGYLDRQCHCVIVRPGNDIDTEPDIRLGLPGWDTFSAALKAMGLSDEKIDMLARESGRSPTRSAPAAFHQTGDQQSRLGG